MSALGENEVSATSTALENGPIIEGISTEVKNEIEISRSETNAQGNDKESPEVIFPNDCRDCGNIPASQLKMEKEPENLKTERQPQDSTTRSESQDFHTEDKPPKSNIADELDKSEIAIDPENSEIKDESPNLKIEDEPQDLQDEDGWIDIIGSGDFKKRVIKAGNGVDTRPKQGNLVVVNYTCYDENDIVVEQKTKFELCVGDLDIIQGLDLAIPLMEVGEIAEVLVPSRLAFGKIGRPPSILPDSKLRYEIELLEVTNDCNEGNLSLSQVLDLGNMKRDRGNFWYSRGDYLNAIHCYQRAASLLDGMQDGSENSSEMLQNILDTRMKVYNNMAAAQLKLEAYDQALKSVDFVLRIQSENVKAHFRKAKILMAKGQTDEALASMKKAAELEPDTKIIQQELQKLTQKKKQEEKSQRAMYKRMFPQSDTKSKSSRKWLKPWSVMAGSCLALAVGVAAYRQYFS